MTWPHYIAAKTRHGRRGAVRNQFRYSVDYLLIDPDASRGPCFFSRKHFNIFAVRDRHHGGQRGQGQGVRWARDQLRSLAMPGADQCPIYLLTQPAFFGLLFNPVSFWLAIDATGLRAVIAEVNNTFGDRHNYLCHKADFSPIQKQDRILARKMMHVSPFQDCAGDYRFSFDITDAHIHITILYRHGPEGVVATLEGARTPLANRHILWAAVRRPLGGVRTLSLIHWQALKLKIKGARFRRRPPPPKNDISTGTPCDHTRV